MSYNKILKLRKKSKIIRFVNYKYKIDPENYCREKLLLYIPWKENELNLLQNFTNYIEAYNFHQKEIQKKCKFMNLQQKSYNMHSLNMNQIQINSFKMVEI